MIERAIVQQVSSSEVKVELGSLAACGGCTACGAFGRSGPQLLRAGNPRGISLQPGDVVEVGFAPGKAVRAGFVVLILPLFLFIAAYAAAGALGAQGDLLKVLSGIGGLALGFAIAWLRGRSGGNLPEIVRLAPADAAFGEPSGCATAGASRQ
jgi:positive regulator of sigma E activity